MKKKIMAMLAAALFCATSYLNCMATTVAADSKDENSSSATTLFMGDVNDDGSFNVADVVLFQKWLLGVPDAELINWRASDFCWDNRLNVFDLALMKRALLEKMNIDPNDDPEICELLFGYSNESSGKPLPDQRLALKCKSFCELGETLKIDVAMGDTYSYHQQYNGYPTYDTLGHAEYGAYTCDIGNYSKIENEKLTINGESSEYKKVYTKEEMEALDISGKFDDYGSYHHETAEIDFSNFTIGDSGSIVFYFHWVYDEENPDNPSSNISGMSKIVGYYVGEKGVVIGAGAEDAKRRYQSLFGSIPDDNEANEIHFGYYDYTNEYSKPMSEIRIAMKCKAFCPAGETLNVDVARLGFSDSQIYEGNSFLYKYFIRSGENWQNLNDERLIVNGKAGGYEKYYYDDDRQMFLVGKEYDDYSTYHHENAELDFQNYTAGSSGCIAFNFAAQFYDDNGNLPEQPQSEGCGQLLYYYVGEDGVGISNTSVEDAEKTYKAKGTGDITPPDTYTGKWHGRNISYGLYQALKANGSETLPVSVTLSDRGGSEFVYNGRTVQEYTYDTMGEDITRMENLLNSIYGGDQLKYGEEIYISGTPDGTKWTKEIYDLTIERYGEELLSKYIVEGEFLKEQLRADLTELKDGYKAALDEAVEAFYTARIEETIAALESQGIRSERIEGTHDIVMYVTAAEFETLSLENASYFNIAFEEPVIL